MWAFQNVEFYSFVKVCRNKRVLIFTHAWEDIGMHLLSGKQAYTICSGYW